ncbi:hypothetical protein [Hyphomicrobium sp.]|uniref:hypothetical protein n=1 Tax=Hyphomicrobium sp. TaxID=82 RepID=UPI002D792208|nr:hypothetical protein [Hyphomicrobium sp.]HET6388024.1 hypothetical protein [Hyphomicrobium sp.]
MKSLKVLLVALSAAALGGCGASLPSLPTTGSLLGTQPKVTPNDPLTRTMDVAATSARAIKCGYNFDPAKLKNQFITAETAANPADAVKFAQVYDTAFNGVSKALAQKGADYCSPLKVARIKLALARHLNGDYTPSPPEPSEDEGGLLSGWGGGDSSSSNKGANMQDMFQ